jgi:hypothetical protein
MASTVGIRGKAKKDGYQIYSSGGTKQQKIDSSSEENIFCDFLLQRLLIVIL